MQHPGACSNCYSRHCGGGWSLSELRVIPSVIFNDDVCFLCSFDSVCNEHDPRAMDMKPSLWLTSDEGLAGQVSNRQSWARSAGLSAFRLTLFLLHPDFLQ